jgi:hypothetical protein
MVDLQRHRRNVEPDTIATPERCHGRLVAKPTSYMNVVLRVALEPAENRLTLLGPDNLGCNGEDRAKSSSPVSAPFA